MVQYQADNMSCIRVPCKPSRYRFCMHSCSGHSSASCQCGARLARHGSAFIKLRHYKSFAMLSVSY